MRIKGWMKARMSTWSHLFRDAMTYIVSADRVC